MARYLPEFLSSNTEGSVSQFLGWQSHRDRLLEVQEDNVRENVVKQEARLSPAKSQASAHSVRRTPMDPKGPESVSSRVPKEPSALMQDPFATISNQRKRKAHQETFEVFIGRSKLCHPLALFWLWPKECYIYQNLRDGLPRKPMLS